MFDGDWDVVVFGEIGDDVIEVVGVGDWVVVD